VITKPQPQATSREYFVKFGNVVFQTYKQTDRQTDININMLIAILCTCIWGKVITINCN